MTASILALPTAPAVTFAVGDLVANFGVIARVLSVEENGDLILREMVTKSRCEDLDPRQGRKWRADAAKCRPVR
jgi:hypothetical protein